VSICALSNAQTGSNFRDGKHAFGLQEYDQAEKHYLAALNSGATNGLAEKIEIYVALGELYKYMGRSVDALKSNEKAFQLASQLKDPNYLFKTKVYYAEYFRWKGDFANALNDLSEAEKYMASSSIDLENRAYYYGRKTAILIQTLASEALIYQFMGKSEKACIQLNDPIKLAMHYNERASFYRGHADFKNAMKYYLIAEDLYKAARNKSDLVNVYINMSICKILEKKYPEAIEYCDEGLHLIDTTNSSMFQNISDLHHYKSDAYQYQKKYERALHELMWSNHYKIKIDFHRNSIQLSELSEKYKSDEKKKELVREKEDKQLILKNYTLQKTRFNQLLFSIVVLVLLFIILFIVSRRLRSSLRVQRKLGSEKDLLIKEVEHRVKNNLQSMISLLSIQIKYVDSNEGKSILDSITQRIKAIELTHSMLNSKLNENFIESQTYFNAFVPPTIESVNNAFGKKVDVHFDIDPVKFDVDQCSCIGAITSELITNSIKHSKTSENIELTIRLKKEGENVHFAYSDSNTDLVRNRSDHPDSLGLKLIELFTKKMKGTVSINELNYDYLFTYTLKR